MANLRGDEGRQELEIIKRHLNAAMLEAAEPEIQAALKKIEREMREALGKKLIGMMESHLDIHREGRDLVIRLRGEFDKGRSVAL